MISIEYYWDIFYCGTASARGLIFHFANERLIARWVYFFSSNPTPIPTRRASLRVLFLLSPERGGDLRLHYFFLFLIFPRIPPHSITRTRRILMKILRIFLLFIGLNFSFFLLSFFSDGALSLNNSHFKNFKLILNKKKDFSRFCSSRANKSRGSRRKKLLLFRRQRVLMKNENDLMKNVFCGVKCLCRARERIWEIELKFLFFWPLPKRKTENS